MASYHDAHLLAALYDGLATPPLSPTSSVVKRRSPTRTAFSLLPTPVVSPLATPIDQSPVSTPLSSLPLGSLLPSQHPKPVQPYVPPRLQIVTDPDSLTREKKGKMPALSHLLSVGTGRVLCLAADEKHVYAGCHSADNEITVFSRASLQPIFHLLGHEGSVLALLVIKEKGWLVSSSSAGDVRIWSTKTLQPIHIIRPVDYTSGDIYSLAWDNRNGGTLYFGSQSASIEWVNFANPSHPEVSSGPSRIRKPSLPQSSASFTLPVNGGETSPGGKGHLSGTSTPAQPGQRSGRYRPHAFFDNPPPDVSSGANTPKGSSVCLSRRSDISDADLSRLVAHDRSPSQSPQEGATVTSELEVMPEARVAFAHYGYVYALHVVPRPNGCAWLVSGSGDCDIKIWSCEPSGGLRLLRTFDNLDGAVLSFAVRDSLLFAGLQDGEIVVWDLETGALIRTIEAHDSDVLTMSVLGTDVYTAAADGKVLRVNEVFDCTAAFKAHNGIILSSTIVKGDKDRWDFITAGNDSYVKVWTIDPPTAPGHDTEVDVEGEGDVMLYALSKLVAIPTVSDEQHREDCRQGAHLLKNILTQLGAQSEVLSGEQGRNPLVLATFSGRDTGKSRKRLLFYGHYDVQPAAESDWETDPYQLSGRNGQVDISSFSFQHPYLYGRGVSDNKGPIMAVACAAASLRQRRELDVDLVMLIEGEEEAGSRGFAPTVRKHKDAIGHIDAVLLSNSTWIGESDPCVVFGMRGVVYANLAVWSASEDAHSGVDGGIVAEPMFDMVRVLHTLADSDGVKLPGFYDHVRPQTAEESQLLSAVASASNRSVKELIKVWRQPSFSIANISAGGPANKTVIPKRVTADISMRLVPDQDLKTIVESLKTFCQNTFQSLASSNKFEITVTHSASWWLASLTSPYLQALEESVKDVWGVAPLKIREGGTVPTICFLEQEFGAPCVHLPLGQASDAGHLANERMRLLNLRNGKRVVKAYLTRVASI